MGRGRGFNPSSARLGTSEARKELPKLVEDAATRRRPSRSLLDRAVEIGSYRRQGAVLIPEIDAKAHVIREQELENQVDELEEELTDLKLSLLIEERLENRRAGRRGTPIEQVARELGFGHLVDAE